MRGNARLFYAVALIVAVATLIISLIEEEPTLLLSSGMALAGFGITIFYSLSKGKNMKAVFPLFTAVCLSISAISAITLYSSAELYTEAPANFLMYAMETAAYLGVALLLLALLFAYFDLRLDRLLTAMCIIFFEIAVSVLGLFAVRVLKSAALEAAGADMMTFVLIAAQYTTGLVIAIIAAFIAFFIMKKKNIRLMSDKIVLEEN
jgi:hypothetical protein